MEHQLHVLARQRRRLVVRAIESRRKRLGVRLGDRALLDGVNFVAHKHDGKETLAFVCAANFLVDSRGVVHRVAVGQIEDDDEALADVDVLVRDGRVLLLARRVQDRHATRLVVHRHLLDERVLDCGLVVDKKHIVDELQRQRALAHAPCAQHDDVVRVGAVRARDLRADGLDPLLGLNARCRVHVERSPHRVIYLEAVCFLERLCSRHRAALERDHAERRPPRVVLRI
eukprot:Amastigsp_a175931_221.p2 type:complete len:229 gc:universal Amastigsp_a175931_221:907-221(-)